MSGSRALRAEFLGRPGERLFAVLHAPLHANASTCVLVVPPFAEEMNKSRRMMAQLSQKLVERGVAAACVDVYGTGDSDGEFDQATWERWVSDIVLAASWCKGEGHPVSHVVGIRLGCALAAAASTQLGSALQASVFWQPVTEGARLVDQFLRVRAAASMMEQSGRETVKDLREQLRSGRTLEVAGYPLSAALTTSVDGVSLTELACAAAMGDIHWIEVVRESKAPTAPTANALESLRTHGRTVKYHQVLGEPFWSATEIVSNPELLGRTTELICNSDAARDA